jgi:hypothetical protein
MQESAIPGPEGGPLGIDVLRAFRSDPRSVADLRRVPYLFQVIHEALRC